MLKIHKKPIFSFISQPISINKVLNERRSQYLKCLEPNFRISISFFLNWTSKFQKWCLEYMLANYTHYTLTANIIMGLWISNRPTRAWDFKSNIVLKESKAHENTFHFPKDILILKGCHYPQCWVGTNIHGLFCLIWYERWSGMK